MESWQQRATEFAQKHNLSHPPSVYALDLMSELGEVTKEILLATDYGERPFQPSQNFQSELGDVLYSLCQLASCANVDLEEAFISTLEKYETRWQDKERKINKTTKLFPYRSSRLTMKCSSYLIVSPKGHIGSLKATSPKLENLE